MKTKHTPGPWNAVRNGGGFSIQQGTTNDARTALHISTVCRVSADKGPDARLIAAAPDGLAFAQSIVENEDVFHAAVNQQPVTPERAQELLAEIYEAARVFIAKATGGA